MKLFKVMKDGGPASRVWGFWLIEIKSLFSVAVLKFEDGARDAYHTHAFNAWSWLLKGQLIEIVRGHEHLCHVSYRPSLRPIYTPRDMFHKVVSLGTSWAITFRGPWSKTWQEYIPETDRTITLTHGRKEINV